ncbi:RNA polymerase sigma-70 factor [Bacteroides sp.]
MKDNHPPLTFNELYQTYKERFLRLAISFIKEESIAEDFVTDSFISYWENRHKLTESVNAPAYILVSLKNECLTYLNRLRKEQEIINHLKSQQEWELDFQISSLNACDPQEIFSEEVQQLVNKAIESLPEKTKEVFWLSRMEYLTNREISEQLGVSTKAVEFHITKALRVMRIALKDYLAAFFYLFLN